MFGVIIRVKIKEFTVVWDSNEMENGYKRSYKVFIIIIIMAESEVSVVLVLDSDLKGSGSNPCSTTKPFDTACLVLEQLDQGGLSIE